MMVLVLASIMGNSGETQIKACGRGALTGDRCSKIGI